MSSELLGLLRRFRDLRGSWDPSGLSGALGAPQALRGSRDSSGLSGLGISMQVPVVNGRNIVSCSSVNHQLSD